MVISPDESDGMILLSGKLIGRTKASAEPSFIVATA
jgi:hypothetical protein